MCDIMAKDNSGDTPLHRAALGGSLSTVCTLIEEFKCDPNTMGFRGRSSVHHAAESGHIDVVRKLVHDYICDVNALDGYGHTPMYCAVSYRNKPLMITEPIIHNGNLGIYLHGYKKMEKSLQHTITGCVIVVGHPCQRKNCPSCVRMCLKCSQSEIPSANCGIFGHIALDCRYTKSQHLENLNLLVQNILKKASPKKITPGAVILYHALTKAGEGTLACSVEQVVRFIKEEKVYLPTDYQYLLSRAKELESHGYVLVLQSSSDSWIVTDIKTFVNSLHEQLFSE